MAYPEVRRPYIGFSFSKKEQQGGMPNDALSWSVSDKSLIIGRNLSMKLKQAKSGKKKKYSLNGVLRFN